MTRIKIFLHIISVLFLLTVTSVSYTSENQKTEKFNFNAVKEITFKNFEIVKNAMDKERQQFFSGKPMNLTKEELKERQRVSVLMQKYILKSQGDSQHHNVGKQKMGSVDDMNAASERIRKRLKAEEVANKKKEVEALEASRNEKTVEKSSPKSSLSEAQQQAMRDKVEKRKAKLRAERGMNQRTAILVGKQREKYKPMPRVFYKTLSCTKCDMTSMKDHIFNCNWCEIEDSNFSKKDRLWSRYKFKWAKLKGADFSRTSIRNTTFYKADLRGADFSGARITQTNFAYANLENAIFKNALIGESLFNSANLKNADFTGAKIVRTDFSFSDMDKNSLKSAELEDVTVKATELSGKIAGVWHLKINNALKNIDYYEFFPDGSFMLLKGTEYIGWGWNLSETDSLRRVFMEHRFHSVRKGVFIKMTPNAFFIDPSRHQNRIPAIYGGKFVLSNKKSSDSITYTRTRGKALEKYMNFRNKSFALRSMFLWNTDVIEKLSSTGVDFSKLRSPYGNDMFDNMFQNYYNTRHNKRTHPVQDDRHTRYIFKTLLRENPGFKSDSESGFEKMVFLSIKFGYVETLKYILPQSSSLEDMQYALIKYKRDDKNKPYNNLTMGLVEERISELEDQ